MFRVVALLVSVISVAAFAPAFRAARSSLKMSYESAAGVIDPTGFFDPLGFTKDIDEATFTQYRTAELKHGRVAQLAVIGYTVPEVFRFPGEIAPGISFSSIPNGVAAINAIPALGWLQIFFLIGSVDYYGFLTFGDTEAKDKSPEELKEAQNKELSNGRLAQIAILELLRHDSQHVVGGLYPDDHLITGLPFLYN